MNELDLTLDELTEIVRTCESIEIDDCTPDYLQDFVAERLADCFPSLSTKVRLFDADQMHQLCAHIKDTYSLLR